MPFLMASDLWTAILAYAFAAGELQGEGNSGEFSTQEESARVEEEFAKAEEKLISVFAFTTGWRPKKIAANKGNNWQESWELLVYAPE